MTRSCNKGLWVCNNRGAALIITLLIITTLAGLVIAFTEESNIDLNLATYTRDGYRASHMAQSGVQLAMALLDEDEDKNMDSLAERWAQFGIESLPGEPPEGTTFTGRIIDENSKFNINKLINHKGEIEEQDLERLKRLFTVLGLNEGHVNALSDWLDMDDIKRLEGAEDYYYQSLERPYPCLNGPLMTVAQLFLVKGFKDFKRFGEKGEKRLEDFLTIYGDGKININTAPREVLMSLDKDIDGTVAQSIIDYRSEEDFSSPSDLAKVPGIDGEVLNRINERISVKASAFSIDLKVTFSEAVSHIKAVAIRDGDTSSLKYYRVM